MSDSSENPSLAIETARGRVFRVLILTLGRLPLPLAHGVGVLLGWLFALVLNRNQRIAQRNIELCFPALGEAARRRLVRRTLCETGKGLAELGRFWTRPPSRVLGLIRDVHGRDALEACLASGKGFVLAAPHLGAWELLCLYLASRHPCTVLYREPRDPGVEAVINAGRGQFGTELVRAGGRGVRQLYRALATGRMVGILPDQQPKRGQGVFAPFFDHPALTMVLFSRLAQKAPGGALIAWARRLPSGAGFDLHFDAVDPAVCGADVDASVAGLNAMIEARVRECPEQYQWGYKRFSIQPDASSPY